MSAVEMLMRGAKRNVAKCPYHDVDKTKYLYVSSEEYHVDDWKDPTGYYVLDALGGAMYFRTRSRAKAQAYCDELFGVGKYRVIKVIKAVAR